MLHLKWHIQRDGQTNRKRKGRLINKNVIQLNSILADFSSCILFELIFSSWFLCMYTFRADFCARILSELILVHVYFSRWFLCLYTFRADFSAYILSRWIQTVHEPTRLDLQAMIDPNSKPFLMKWQIQANRFVLMRLRI